MARSLDQLPDDPGALKRIIADLHHSYEAQIESLNRDYQEKRENLKAQLLLALKREFGRSSEAPTGAPPQRLATIGRSSQHKGRP
jgi:hypothetical protein